MSRLNFYTVIVEKANENYSAYVIELPGCVTTGNTIDEVQTNIQEAIAFHLEGLSKEELPAHNIALLPTDDGRWFAGYPAPDFYFDYENGIVDGYLEDGVTANTPELAITETYKQRQKERFGVKPNVLANR